ncbi:hypothetical protein [Microbacterium memoriense]|uniref:Uncharacterized protein n=1 Tax=Microbacterium memoriense TaxID=2978350 RepID=A0ABT2P8D5_9MICO|nr:hypothetical protein [Microbacterium memoriense]MCT9000789.1 hypothetical protein [Microbacterium memoriense]
MQARALPNGNLLIPVPLYGDDGLTGEGMVEVTSDDPRYAHWIGHALPA